MLKLTNRGTKPAAWPPFSWVQYCQNRNWMFFLHCLLGTGCSPHPTPLYTYGTIGWNSGLDETTKLGLGILSEERNSGPLGERSGAFLRKGRWSFPLRDLEEETARGTINKLQCWRTQLESCWKSLWSTRSLRSKYSAAYPCGTWVSEI